MPGVKVVNKKQYEHDTFKDLIAERIMFESAKDATEILQEMFPGATVKVTIDDNGKTKARVDKAVLTITQTKI